MRVDFEENFIKRTSAKSLLDTRSFNWAISITFELFKYHI